MNTSGLFQPSSLPPPVCPVQSQLFHSNSNQINQNQTNPNQTTFEIKSLRIAHKLASTVPSEYLELINNFQLRLAPFQCRLCFKHLRSGPKLELHRLQTSCGDAIVLPPPIPVRKLPRPLQLFFRRAARTASHLLPNIKENIRSLPTPARKIIGRSMSTVPVGHISEVTEEMLAEVSPTDDDVVVAPFHMLPPGDYRVLPPLILTESLPTFTAQPLDLPPRKDEDDPPPVRAELDFRLIQQTVTMSVNETLLAPLIGKKKSKKRKKLTSMFGPGMNPALFLCQEQGSFQDSIIGLPDISSWSSPIVIHEHPPDSL